MSLSRNLSFFTPPTDDEIEAEYQKNKLDQGQFASKLSVKAKLMKAAVAKAVQRSRERMDDAYATGMNREQATDMGMATLIHILEYTLEHADD